MNLVVITEVPGEGGSDPYIIRDHLNDLELDICRTGEEEKILERRTQADSASGDQEVRVCNGAVIWLMFWMKHAAHLTHTFLFGLGDNLNVVTVHEHKVLQCVTVDIIDQRLEDSSSIGDTEWNHQVFIAATCLPPRSRQDDRRRESRRDEWQEMVVFHSVVTQAATVDTRLGRLVLLNND